MSTRVAVSSFRRSAPAVLAAAALSFLPAASVAAPARGILVCGDSMVKTVARSLTREFAPVPTIQLTQVISIGTGLARPDVFDWPAKLREATASRPEAVVIMLGANDGQNLKTAAGAVVAEGSPGWGAEYAARIASMLAQVKAAGARHILWIGMPDMRDTKMQADAQRINAIAKAECAKVPGAEFMDTAATFSPRPGTYSAYVIQAGGKPLQVRASDGTHLNSDGADIMARVIRARLGALMALQ
jgi:uncharacterized protein